MARVYEFLSFLSSLAVIAALSIVGVLVFTNLLIDRHLALILIAVGVIAVPFVRVFNTAKERAARQRARS